MWHGGMILFRISCQIGAGVGFGGKVFGEFLWCLIAERRMWARFVEVGGPAWITDGASPCSRTRSRSIAHRDWVLSIGLEPSAYGTHSMRRTKVAQIYKKTGNLRAVQLLLGQKKMDSIVRYLGVDLDDALSLSEGIDL